MYSQSLGASHSEEHVGDPKRLRRWLREMEAQMDKSPSYTVASKMKHSELQKRLNEHSVSLCFMFLVWKLRRSLARSALLAMKV